MRVFSWAVVAGCFGLAALAVIVQFHPAGPAGVVSRSVQEAALVSGVAFGVRWLRRPWPSYQTAIAFVFWADFTVAAVAVTMSTTEARLCTTQYLGLIGVFVGFMLGPRLLALHCVFGAAVIAGITGWAVAVQHASLFGLFVVYMPALMWVVVIPAVGCVLIERGRRAIVRVARSAHRDQLTGLRNRRGMHAALHRVVRESSPGCLSVAVCDIDRFKRLNDELGHAAGDAALTALADCLQTMAQPDEIAARIGGDELVLVTFGDGRDRESALATRLTALTRIEFDGIELSVSVGVASMSTAAPHFSLDDVIRHADSAMYDVKRSGGGACAVYQQSVI